MNSQARDTQSILNSVASMKAILTKEGVTRESLDRVAAELVKLATDADWSAQRYPAPPAGQTQIRYLIHQEPDQTYALYLNAMNPGKKSLPHNHDTWVCVAAIRGVETNKLYDRLDDGAVAGYAELVLRETVEVSPGRAVSLMPGDVHAIEVNGHEPVWQLHLYGLPVEAQTGRLAFDIENKRSFEKGVGVKTVAA